MDIAKHYRKMLFKQMRERKKAKFQRIKSEVNRMAELWQNKKPYYQRLLEAAPEMLRELKSIGHQTTITTEHFNRLQRLIERIEG